MRSLIVLLVAAVTVVASQTPAAVEYEHRYTFGSKQGIHPPKILNRRAVTIALGKGDFPYGIGFPTGVIVDHRHRVWITDSATGSIHVFDRATGSYREFRRLDDVSLQQPAGITTDEQGRIYVTDSGTGGIYVFDHNGEYDHPLLSKESPRMLEAPTAIVVASNGGTVFVLDPPQHTVFALNREGEPVGRIYLSEKLNNPTTMTLVDNQVYVLGVDQHTIQIFSQSGRLVGEQHWDGVRNPSAFAWDGERRRFVVANPRWMVIEIFNEQGQNLGAFGQRGEGVDQMEQVDSLYVDPKGVIYVVDSHHGKVLSYSESGQPR